jgi:adenine-specific DNA-methyltransferase
MTPARSNGGIRRKLDKLRLIVAQETFCNRINRDATPKDIPLEAAAHELYGQYCLSICLDWLATKYGFPVYTPGINPRFHAVLGRDRYPFNTPPDMPLSEACVEAAFAYLDATFEPKVELIGRMYMHLLGDRMRGEFYTPADVVRHCVDVAFEAVPKCVLDPACGTGNFLLGVLRRVREELDGERLLEWVCDCLYGSDIDGRAVQLAKASIFVELSYELTAHPDWLGKLSSALDQHIVIEDSLTSGSSRNPDLVITNPPYISFGSRNQPQMPVSQSAILRRLFPSSSEYKIRIHSIFQELALQRLENEGVAVLLVPDAFLSGAYYKKLRRLIAESCSVELLCELPESTFPDAVAGKWCIAKYRKTLQTSTSVLQQSDGTRIVSQLPVAQDDLIDIADKYRFQVVFNRDDAEVLRLCRKLARVADFARGHTGIRARKGQNSIIADRAESTAHKRGLISGASIHQHSVRWDGKYLHIDPAQLFAGGFDPAIIEQPKILMRQTADRIIAGVDTDCLYHLNNIHSFAPIIDLPPHWIYFLSGVMNSALWLRLYQLRSRERSRALAQIDIEMIESMPMPNVDDNAIARIADLAREGAQGAIDELVYDLYEIRDHAKVN